MLCIASDINENQDIIKDKVNGLLCDRSSSGIALALSRATTVSNHEEIRANARKLIVSKYSVENAVEREFELYESLLS